MLKRISIILSLIVLTAFISSGCVLEDILNSSLKRRTSTESEKTTDYSESTSSREEMSKNELDAEYERILKQIDELEQVLNSLDFFQEEDMTIPEP